jgi:RNA methyltransferase, TrmH family
VLTSAKNPKIASAVRLRKRALRDDARRFLVEGAQAVGEALDAGRLETLFTSDDLDPLAVRSRQLGVETYHVSDQIVRRLTSTVTPQPLVGVSSFLDVSLEEGLDGALVTGGADGAGGCIALLHEVRDPGNAGTVVRSADAAGAGALVFSATSVDVYNPKTVRASAGSIFHLPVVRGASTLEAVGRAKQRGVRVLAMAADGATDLDRADLSGLVMFVFGNESSGLPPEVKGLADGTVRVPQSSRAESLNLAAAATVCLFEWRRRSRRPAEALENIVGAAAHDIRSPLTAMKGFGYALERRWDAMDDEQRTMMLRGIVHDADRMDTILRLLVDAARVIAGNLEVFPEQVDVAGLVGSVAEQQRRDPDHPTVVWTGGEVIAFVDPARLRTTILAFCESLVWWGGEGPIEIEAENDVGVLRLHASRRVDDLSVDDVEALFLPRRPGEGAGTKIGLFVSRGLAEAQGGRCWGAVSEDLLTFHLELPAGPDTPVL